jgi:hypothetical protein
MKETFDAIYENGVLRPLRNLPAREGQRVRVSLEDDLQAASGGDGPSRGSYDFSDLIGRLVWRGDPLAEQKRIRDEWR